MPTKNLKIADYLVDINNLIKTRSYDDALASCILGCKDLPENPAIFMQLAKVHRLRGAHADAAQALETSRSKGLPDKKYFTQKLENLWVANDLAGYTKTSQQMRKSGHVITERTSGNLIKCYYMAENWAEAEKEADLRLEQNIAPVFSNYKIIAALMADKLVNPIGVLQDRIFGPRGNPFMATGVLTVHMHMDEDAIALHDIAQRMAAKWPDHPAILPLIAELKQFSTTSSSLKNKHLKTGADVIDDAKNLFGKYQDSAAAFKHQLSAKTFRRDLVMDIATKDILISPRGDSDTVALVFLGAGGGALGPIQLLDSYLAAKGITAIYIRDLNRLIFTLGIKSLGDIEASAHGLSEILADIGTGKKTIAIGFSGGGMGALNIGMEMGVDRIICFSTPANATLPFIETIGDTRAPLFKFRLQQLSTKADLDAKQRLNRYNFTAPIELYYSEKVAIDRAHAEYLGDLANVKLRPFFTKHGHNSLMAAISTGWLPAILSDEVTDFNGEMHPDMGK